MPRHGNTNCGFQKGHKWFTSPASRAKAKASKEKFWKSERGLKLRAELSERFKGRKLSDETKKKMSRHWKGKNKREAVGYGGVHDWLKSNFGSPDRCENKECGGTSTNYQWAKKKNCKYERIRDNFIMLCVSCHAKYDRGSLKI